MKPKLLPMVILVILLLATAFGATAHLAEYSLPWWTSDSGGGTSTGGNYSLSGTIGQPDAASLSGGNYRLEGGFWGGIGTVAAFQRGYLPLTSKP